MLKKLETRFHRPAHYYSVTECSASCRFICGKNAVVHAAENSYEYSYFC